MQIPPLKKGCKKHDKCCKNIPKWIQKWFQHGSQNGYKSWPKKDSKKNNKICCWKNAFHGPVLRRGTLPDPARNSNYKSLATKRWLAHLLRSSGYFYETHFFGSSFNNPPDFVRTNSTVDLAWSLGENRNRILPQSSGTACWQDPEGTADRHMR